MSDAASALRAACLAAGVPAAPVEPVRLGENAIYRLPGGIIGRVARFGRLAAADREIKVARWLAASGLPAVQPLDVSQPIDVDGRAVTFWHELPAHDSASAVEIAGALRRLHDLPIPPHVPLGSLDPFVRIAARINEATKLTDDTRAWLHRRCRELESHHRALESTLPPCVVHGDAWAGNVAATRDGLVIFLDLERCSIGPPEWDLVSTAIKHTSLATISAEDYQAFCDRYGYDVTTWPGYELFRDIRELRMCTYVAQLGTTRPDAHREALHRIRCLTGVAGPRPWTWTAF